MAKLAEGMTRSKSDWGTVYHMYRGVRISKRSTGYGYTIQYVQHETGRVLNRDAYAAYQLSNVPAEIDALLDDEGKYFVDTQRNIVCLNPDYVEQMRTDSIERIEKEIAAMTDQVSSLLAAQNFKAVEQGAQTLIKLQTQLLTIKSNLQ